MQAQSKKLTLGICSRGNWTANQISAITVILIIVLILFCETTFICTDIGIHLDNSYLDTLEQPCRTTLKG